MTSPSADKPPGQQDAPGSGPRIGSGRLWLPTPIYFIALAATVLAQALWAPKWFVSSRTGLQILVQALPTALIALFALAFATLFVAVQQVTNVFSSRAPLILASDLRVRRIVARTILITAASLLLGGIIPDPPKPLRAYMTATGTTLLIASAALIYSYGRFAYILIMDYSAPRSFVAHVVDPVANILSQKKVKTGLVVYRVPLLGQTLRYALRREDAETLYASLDGLASIQRLYVKASTENQNLRSHQIAPNNIREAWLGDELYRIFTSACEEALRLQSPQHEIDQIVDYFAAATRKFIAAHQEAESKQMMDGLTQLATSPYQVTSGVTNFMTRPASSLASAEECAEREGGQTELASFALADWAVAIAYPQVHFGIKYHPLFAEGVRKFGGDPPWNEAINRVRDPSWNIRWANQLQYRLDVAISMLELARALHEGPDGPEFRARKKAVYVEWLDTTRNVAVGLVENATVFMRRLEGANHNISIFGSPDVKEATSSYFASYQGIVESLSSNVASAQPDELVRAVSAAFQQEAITTTRAAVLSAMEEDLGEDLE